MTKIMILALAILNCVTIVFPHLFTSVGRFLGFDFSSFFCFRFSVALRQRFCTICKGTMCMLGLVLEQLAFYILLLVRYNVAVLLHLVKNDKRQYGWGIGSLYFVLSHLCLTLPFVISVANSLCLVLVNFLIHLIFGIYSTSDSGQTQTGKLGYFQFNCPPFFGHFLHQYYSLR